MLSLHLRRPGYHATWPWRIPQWRRIRHSYDGEWGSENLKNLNPNKASDQDQISSRILKAIFSPITSALLDFSKAFDKVSHRRLAIILNHYGVRGNTLALIQYFLSCRTQQEVGICIRNIGCTPRDSARTATFSRLYQWLTIQSQFHCTAMCWRLPPI